MIECSEQHKKYKILVASEAPLEARDNCTSEIKLLPASNIMQVITLLCEGVLERPVHQSSSNRGKRFTLNHGCKDYKFS